MFKDIFKKAIGSDKEGSENPATGNIEKDLTELKGLLGGDGSNFLFRWFTRDLCLVYVSVLVDDNVINRDILANLPGLLEGQLTPANLPVGQVSKTEDLKAAAAKILRGYSALLLKGSREIYIYDTRGVPR